MLTSAYSRRNFLKTGTVMSGLFVFSNYACAIQAPTRSLALNNIHTGESLKLDYWEQGVYINESIDEINYLLRDHRRDEVHVIDINLIEQLHRLSAITRTNKSFEVISGYRSPETNEMLRRKSKGVARNSLHIKGKAVDIQLPGLSMEELKKAAMSMQSGGVGKYRHFVHIDTGRVRYW